MLPFCSILSCVAAKPPSDEDSDSHHPKPWMVVSPGRKVKMKAINHLNCAAGRCLAMLDDSDNEVGSDEATPVYESHAGTKTTGLDDILVT